MPKKIWQLEDDVVYRYQQTLYKVWQDHIYYYCNCRKDWVELENEYGEYEEVEK